MRNERIRWDFGAAFQPVADIGSIPLHLLGRYDEIVQSLLGTLFDQGNFGRLSKMRQHVRTVNLHQRVSSVTNFLERGAEF